MLADNKRLMWNMDRSRYALSVNAKVQFRCSFSPCVSLTLLHVKVIGWGEIVYGLQESLCI